MKTSCPLSFSAISCGVADGDGTGVGVGLGTALVGEVGARLDCGLGKVDDEPPPHPATAEKSRITKTPRFKLRII